MASPDMHPAMLDISPDGDKGVLKEIIQPGEGDATPCKGNKVSVHYTGKLEDGTIFDSSVDRGEMFQFTLGKGEVIKAWDIGVATMKKGEKCFLMCKPEYAYGKKGSPPKIPENAILVFQVELFSWEMEDLSPDHDKGILRSVISEGDGFVTPDEGSNVEVHLLGRCQGKQFEEKTVKFELGIGSEAGIVNGLEIALKQFQKGEKSNIILAPKYAFGSEGKAELNIPPNATVEYEVTLKSFEKEKEAWNMTPEEKIEQSEIAKAKGTNYFKSEKYELASKMYKRIINYLRHESENEGEILESRKKDLVVAGYLNLAACYLKLENLDEVLINCDKVLEIEPKNTKGLFRKGQAKLALHDYEVAQDCFSAVLENEKSNKAALKNIYICKENLKKELEKEKKMYQNMFKKMAEEKDEDEQKNGTEEVGTEESKTAEESVPV